MEGKCRVLGVGLFVALLTVAGCSSKGKYADAKQVQEDHIRATESYLSALDKAGSAAAVAKAMNSYADDMAKIMPKMKKIAEKYPELKPGNDVPEEFKELAQRAEQVGQKMGSMMMKVMPYMQDPEVQKAQQRMHECMISQ